MISLHVSDLLKENEYQLGLELAAGKGGLSKKIMITQIQKPGLALTGYTANIQPGRIQVLGNSEIHFLNSLPAAKCAATLRKICGINIACLVVTNHNDILPPLRKEAERSRIPVLRTTLTT